MICRSSQIAPPEGLHVLLVGKALYHVAKYVVIKKSYKKATTLIKVLRHQYS